MNQLQLNTLYTTIINQLTEKQVRLLKYIKGKYNRIEAIHAFAGLSPAIKRQCTAYLEAHRTTSPQQAPKTSNSPAIKSAGNLIVVDFVTKRKVS